jgi:TolB protein
MDDRGGHLQRLPQVGVYNTSPDWSPSGDEIAYNSRVGGERYDIYVTTVSTGTVRRLTSKGSNEEAHYSADGRFLVYSSTRNGGPHLWIMNANGGAKRQVTHGPGQYMTPSWQR